MKNLFLLPFLAVAASLPASAKTTAHKTTAHKTPVQKKASNAMPAEVRASFPKGATNLFLRPMPMGPNGRPVLVHLWAAGRHPYRKTPGSFADPSPFCVDVFALGDKGSEHPGHLGFSGQQCSRRQRCERALAPSGQKANADSGHRVARHHDDALHPHHLS